VNNTVYQLVGDALRVEGSSRDLQVRNNVLWVKAGYDINVAADSQPGFQSDYNDLYATGAGRIGYWQLAARSNLSAWQNAVANDLNSLSGDPLFVAAAGADGLLGYAGPDSDGRDDDFHLTSLCGSYHGGALAPVLNDATGLPTFLAGNWMVDTAQSPGIDRGSSADGFALEPSPNGHYVNLGAYGNTPQASLSPEQYITILRPNGGDAWPADQTSDPLAQS